MSPEYAMKDVFSIKSDVLMLEIMSGRRNNSFNQSNHVLNLVGNVCNMNLNFGSSTFS